MAEMMDRFLASMNARSMEWVDDYDLASLLALSDEERGEAERALLERLKQPDSRAPRALAAMGARSAVPALEAELPRATGVRKVAIALALEKLAGYPEAAARIRETLADDEASDRLYAAYALRAYPGPETESALMKTAADDPDGDARSTAAESILLLKGARKSPYDIAHQEVLNAIAGTDRGARAAALQRLSQLAGVPLPVVEPLPAPADEQAGDAEESTPEDAAAGEPSVRKRAPVPKQAPAPPLAPTQPPAPAPPSPPASPGSTPQRSAPPPRPPAPTAPPRAAPVPPRPPAPAIVREPPVMPAPEVERAAPPTAPPVPSAPARSCAKCGVALKPTDKFCLRCGGAAVTATPACSRCRAPLAAGVRFCKTCGAPVAAVPAGGEVAKSAPMSRHCPRCGQQAEMTVKFCNKCGTRF